MATAKDLDMLQTFVAGKVDMLDQLIVTVHDSGSRPFREQLLGIRAATQRYLEQVTRDMFAARAHEAAAADEQKDWRDRAGPGLHMSFSKPSA